VEDAEGFGFEQPEVMAAKRHNEAQNNTRLRGGVSGCGREHSPAGAAEE
jgi:hypothetical protein